MKGRLYRFTPAGGKPEHFTHDFRSASICLDAAHKRVLATMDVGHIIVLPNDDSWERVA